MVVLKDLFLDIVYILINISLYLIFKYLCLFDVLDGKVDYIFVMMWLFWMSLFFILIWKKKYFLKIYFDLRGILFYRGMIFSFFFINLCLK